MTRQAEGATGQPSKPLQQVCRWPRRPPDGLNVVELVARLPQLVGVAVHVCLLLKAPRPRQQPLQHRGLAVQAAQEAGDHGGGQRGARQRARAPPRHPGGAGIQALALVHAANRAAPCRPAVVRLVQVPALAAQHVVAADCTQATAGRRHRALAGLLATGARDGRRAVSNSAPYTHLLCRRQAPSRPAT